MKIGDKIRQIRKANKMTLSELALRVDSDVGNLSRLERGMQGYSDPPRRRTRPTSCVLTATVT